jgi:hypothetical protein
MIMLAWLWMTSTLMPHPKHGVPIRSHSKMDGFVTSVHTVAGHVEVFVVKSRL